MTTFDFCNFQGDADGVFTTHDGTRHNWREEWGKMGYELVAVIPNGHDCNDQQFFFFMQYRNEDD